MTELVDRLTENSGVTATLNEVTERARDLSVPNSHDALGATLDRSLRVFLRRQLLQVTPRRPGMADLPPMLGQYVAALGSDLTGQSLPSLVELRTANWRAAVLELLERLENDRPLLDQVFGLDPDARLEAVSTPLGDLHDHGRSVYKVTFSDGRALIYKPRQVDTEYNFGRVIDWLCRESGGGPGLAYCLALPRPGYGWTAYVSTESCSTLDEIEPFYQRQGAFLALFLLLCGGDCIYDNFVVHGSQPIWVDTECVCKPEFELVNSGLHWLNDSVLATAMLWKGNPVGVSTRRYTGLAVSCSRDRSLVFTNDDVMRDVCRTAVLTGFSDAYSVILRKRGEWISDDGPLGWWRDIHTRIAIRGTMFYAALGTLRLGTDWTRRAALDRDIETVLRSRGDSEEWPGDLVQAEMVALRRADVPYWSASTTSRDVQEATGAVVRGLSRLTGMECITRRASQMSGEDLRSQLWMIDSVLRLPVQTGALLTTRSQSRLE